MLESLQSVIDKFPQCEDWFDIAAHCYRFIGDVVDRNELTEENYVSLYVAESPDSPNPNPNIPIQKELVGQFRSLVLGTSGFPDAFRMAVDQIRDILSCVVLAPYLETEPNESTVVWSLLVAIDSRYAQFPFFRKRAGRQPLNRNADNLSLGVYLRFPHSDIGGYLKEKGLCRIPEEMLQNQFESLIFFDKEERKRFPEIRRIPDASSRQRTEWVSAKDGLPDVLQGTAPSEVHAPRLRIGSCPLTSNNIADFDSSFPVQFVRGEGVSFTVRYNDSVDVLYDSTIGPALSAAIAHGCHILIFPEMVFAPSFHKRLAKSLRTLRDTSNLALVVAGSTWDEGKKRNYSTFYDCCGNVLGFYCKKKAFSQRSKDIELIEYLSIPDEPDTFVDVPGVGRVMTAICKDIVSDDSEVFKLADTFSPHVVCIPAYSASVEGGFKLPMDRLARRHLAVSCMANYCATRCRPNQSDLGYACVPEYDPTSFSSHPKAMFEPIQKGLCAEDCGKRGQLSCLEVIDIDYTSAAKSGSFPNIRVEKIRF